jgi:hypothetical protein
MKKFIVNQKNKKGIIAEIVGTNMLRIQKRKADKFPINIVIRGDNYDVVASDTLSGESEHIECVDGKINTDKLLIIEREDVKDGEEEIEPKQEPKPNEKPKE